VQRSGSAKPTVSIIVILLVLLLSSCIVTEDSPAPGRIRSIGLPTMGGCFGKTAILGLTVEPENKCSAITVNNCNGGVLEVVNSCQETLVLDGVEISSSDHVSLDVIEEDDGTTSVNDVGGNFSDYVPEENKSITITGLLGSQEING